MANLITTGSWREGGLSTAPVETSPVPLAAFRNAPHFSEGGVTSGGTPAVLHPNEAVIPLSRGRKVPVEISGGTKGGGKMVSQTFNFTVNSPDADSFRRSQDQIALDMARAGSAAMAKNG